MPWRFWQLLLGCLWGLPAPVLSDLLAGEAAWDSCGDTNAANSDATTNCTNVTVLVPRGSSVLLRHGHAPVVSASVAVSMHGDTALLELSVGEVWEELQLNLAAGWSAHWTSPELRFVRGSAKSDSDCGEDWALDSDSVASDALTPDGTLRLTSTGEGGTWAVSANLTFLKTGRARVCFSHNGSFWEPQAELLNFNISVLGLLDATCSDSTCDLALQRVECHRNGTGSCSLRYGGRAGTSENASASWTPHFEASYSSASGAELEVLTRVCGSGPPASGVLPGKEVFVPEDPVAAAEGPLLLTLPLEQGAEPATVAVCYCPGITGRGCSSPSDYTQQIGLVLVYAAAACDPAEGESCGTTYRAVLVGQRFMLRVFCPPDGCGPGTGSRVKLIARDVAAALPSWDDANACRQAPHMDSWLPRGNCDSPTACSQDGGARQDYRSWGSGPLPPTGRGDWWAWEPAQNPDSEWDPESNPGADRLDLRHEPLDADICFCDGPSCNSAKWFKVGELRVAATRLATGSGGSIPSDHTAPPTLVGTPGALSLMRPPEDVDALGLFSVGNMWLLPDPALSATTADCNADVVEPFLWRTHAERRLAMDSDSVDNNTGNRSNDSSVEESTATTSTTSTSTTSTTITTTATQMEERGPEPHEVFTEGTTIVLDEPGILAVCYCSSPVLGFGCPSGGFVLAGRFTVSGPTPGQRFHVSTHGLFRIDYVGHGLLSSDVLLLSEEPCNSSSAVTGTALVATGCPWACSSSSEVRNASTDIIATTLLTHSTVGCDDLGGHCRSARLWNISSGPGGTELGFESEPGFVPGDRIAIGAGVEGGTASQLQTLRGQGVFAAFDGGSDGGWSHVVGHEVSPGANSRRWHIPLAFSGLDAPAFTVSPLGAEWARHNRASTQRELLGPASYAATPALHVCWRGGHHGSTQGPASDEAVPPWFEVGTLVFAEPLAFAEVALVLVAPVANEAVPVVLAFRTGSHAHPSGRHGTALVLRFTDMDRLAPRTVGGAVPALGLSRPSGTQGHCAEVLLETWSSDADVGFPMPRSCRFGQPYQSEGRTLVEFELVFEPQAGLARNTDYQLLLNVQAAEGVLDSEELLQLEATDDLEEMPNAAVAVGAPRLASASDAALTTGRSWLVGLEVVSDAAFTPLGSETELVALEGSGQLSLSLRMSGNPSGGVASGYDLRVLLWPLTQWDLGASIAVACDAPYQCGPSVSSEPVEGTVPGRHLNSAFLRGMQVLSGAQQVEIAGSVRPVLTLTGPYSLAGGFFAVRPAAVVSNTLTSTHQYFQPLTGPALHRAVAPFGALVSSRGHGNAEPFPFTRNALYLRLFLPTALPPEANLTIESPAFFRSCGEAEPLPRDRLLPNPLLYPGAALTAGEWQTETVFGYIDPELTCCNRTLDTETVPQACRWVHTYHQSAGMMTAGSSFYMQVTVLNPPYTIYGDNSTNAWTVSVHDLRLNVTVSAPFAAQPGLSAEDDLTTDLPVILRMPFAQAMPGSLLPGVEHTLQVFFEVAESVDPSGAVEVWAPAGFDFGDPCTAADLSDEIYRYGTGPITAVLERLPWPQSCISRIWPLGSAERTVAHVPFLRPVLSGRRFAFGLTVRNPLLAASADGVEDSEVPSSGSRPAWTQQPLLWTVRVIDAAGHVVEEAAGAAALDGVAAANATESWDLCVEGLVPQPQFRWGTLLPYHMTLATSHVTVLPLEFARDVYVPLRLTAPLGYVWEEPQADRGYWQNRPPGSTATMPGGLPSVDREVFLQWKQPIVLRSGLKYGFRAPIQVPEWPRTSSAFYLELGNPGEPLSSATKPLCAVMPGPTDLRVVREPIVDYLTGKIEEQQEVTIRLRTITAIYPGEGFLFVGGLATIRLVCDCPSQERLMEGLDCVALSGQLSGSIMFRLISTTSLRPGLYSFPFSCTNPAFTDTVDTWTLGSYENPLNYPQVVQLDGEALVPGFALQPPLDLFERLSLSAAAGQDPRSRRRSSTVLTFRLTNETTAGRDTTHMRLRAPEGSHFTWQCLDEVFTDKAAVFGAGEGFPDTYEATGPLHLCEGRGHIAHLHWQQPLEPRVTYAFRVTPLNPLWSPEANVWTLEVDGQSSGLESGIHIQAFERVTLALAATGAKYAGSELGDNYTNRVKVTFSPSVPAQALELTAPMGYDFGDHRLCSHLRLVGETDPVAGQVLVAPTFVPRLSSCEASGLTLRLVWDQAQNWSMTLGVLYTLDADILLPASPTPDTSEPGSFHLLSTGVGDGFGDEYWISAPRVWLAPVHFLVTNIFGEVVAPKPVELAVEVAFATTIRRQERVELKLPRRFTFDDTVDVEGVKKACPARWQVPPVGPEGTCACDDETAVCALTFTLLEDYTWAGDDSRVHAPWPAGWPLHFTTYVVNPIAQPSIFENSFVISHFPPVRALNWTTPYGVGSYRSWELISPVTGLRFSIAAGSPQRAGAVGVLHLTFVPSNDATILRITGLEPSGWGFLTSAVCRVGDSGSVLCRVPSTDPEQPERLELLDTSIASGETYVRQLRNVQFAFVGGPAFFALATFRQDTQGRWIVVDQVERHQSFRLPGHLDVTEPRLRTSFAVQYPADRLWAQLPPRVGLEEAAIFWHFSLTQEAFEGDWLVVQVVVAGTLELDTRHAGISVFVRHPLETGEDALDVGDAVPLEQQEQERPEEVWLRLGAPLRSFPAVYAAHVSGTVLGSLQGAGSAKFVNVSICRPDEPLPINTNDAVAPGGASLPERLWVAASVLPDFGVNPMGVAPISQVMVAGFSPSSLDYPTLTLVTPPGVRILAPCRPSSCAEVDVDFSSSGRQAARSLLTTGDFSLRVEMPREWDDNSWVALTLADSEGGGSSAVGVPLWQSSRDITFRQMPVELLYPAVALVPGVRVTVGLSPGIGAVQVLNSDNVFTVRLKVPLGYKVHCTDFFRTITVPVLTQAGCVEEDEYRSARVTISAPDNVRLQAGQEIVFTLGLEIPVQTPDTNFFEVILLAPGDVTVDANTEAPGLIIPPQRLRSQLALEASDFENLAFLQSWLQAANASGVLAEGLALALQAQPMPGSSSGSSSIAVELLEALLLPSSDGSSGDGLRASVGLNFSVALRTEEGSLETLLARFEQEGLAQALAKEIMAAAERRGMTAVTLRGLALTEPVQVVPPNVTTPSLFWTQSIANSLADVSVGFVFNNATTNVHSVLIYLPAGFSHELHSLADMRVKLDGVRFQFPVDSNWGNSWIDARSGRAVRVLVADGALVRVGGYEFQFPVRVPLEVPDLNVWQLCLCASQECDTPQHVSVLTVFAIPGFRIGEEYPRPAVASTSRGLYPYGAASLVAVAAALGASWLLPSH